MNIYDVGVWVTLLLLVGSAWIARETFRTYRQLRYIQSAALLRTSYRAIESVIRSPASESEETLLQLAEALSRLESPVSATVMALAFEDHFAPIIEKDEGARRFSYELASAENVGTVAAGYFFQLATLLAISNYRIIRIVEGQPERWSVPGLDHDYERKDLLEQLGVLNLTQPPVVHSAFVDSIWAGRTILDQLPGLQAGNTVRFPDSDICATFRDGRPFVYLHVANVYGWLRDTFREHLHQP